MVCLLMLALAVFLGDDKQLGEKTPDPKLALKTILMEADKRYKSAIKECRSKKTSADRDECAEKHVTDFADWIDSKNKLPVEFECRVINVVRDKNSGAYVAVLTNPKELAGFAPGNESKPVWTKADIRLPIEEEQKEGLEPGATILIRSELSVGLASNKHVANLDFLFCVENDVLVMSGEGVQPYDQRFSSVPVSLDEIEFEVVKKIARKPSK